MDLIKIAEEAFATGKQHPSFKAGDTVTVAYRIIEGNKERVFLNAGPHLLTFVLPSQIYPVEERSRGAGLAACMGKLGAVLGVFFIPMLLAAGGARLVLWVSIAVMLSGAALTMAFGRIVLPKDRARQM